MPKAIDAGKNSSPLSPVAGIDGADLIPAILIQLYMIVEFIPRLGAIDVSGPQWVYLSVINLLVIAYLLTSKKPDFDNAVKIVSGSLFTVVYLLFFIVSGLSIMVAINKVESIVCYARVITTLLMYINIAVLLYGRLHWLRLLAQTISIILLIKSLLILGQFFMGIHQGRTLEDIILAITLNAGHKNVLSASIAIQLPFLVYAIHKSGFWAKVLNIFIFILAVSSVLILNTRSVFVALLLDAGIYTAYSLTVFLKSKSWRKTIVKIGGIVMLLAAVTLLSNFLLKKSASKNDPLSYGSFTKRLSSIEFSDKGSSNRLWLWHNVTAYISDHPLMGCGIGNWKITSIAYERNFLNGMLVAYHAHNDFLETTAETGIFGGLLFLSVFAVLVWYLVKAFAKGTSPQVKELPLFLLMSVTCYLVDASLNFPGERPVMQFYFAFILAAGLNVCLAGELKLTAWKAAAVNIRWLAGVGTCLLVPALIIQFMTYTSMIAQAEITSDVIRRSPQKNWADIKDAFPPIPNMTSFCIPVDEIKARYLIKDNQFDKAFSLLNGSRNVNPALGYNDYLRGLIYRQQNNLDSAFHYAGKAFYLRSKDVNYYVLLLDVSTQKRDSAAINRIFDTERALRNEWWLWVDYFNIMDGFNMDKQKLLALAKDAVFYFPDNKQLKQKELYYESFNAFGDYIASAKKAADQHDFRLAIDYFKKAAAANPSDYTVYENTGMCYYFLKDYKNAIALYNKAISARGNGDGKSEFYIGLSNIGLNNKAEACKYLHLADACHYPYAKSNIAIFCK